MASPGSWRSWCVVESRSSDRVGLRLVDSLLAVLLEALAALISEFQRLAFAVWSSRPTMRRMYTNGILVAISTRTLSQHSLVHTACHLAQEQHLSATAWASHLHLDISARWRVELAMHSRAAVAFPLCSPQHTRTEARSETAAVLRACHPA